METCFKGSVQRKLRWVENGVNRSVGASDCGSGHSFVVLFRFHLGFTIFPFPVSTPEFIGKFWKNKRSATSDVAPEVGIANFFLSPLIANPLIFFESAKR